MEAFIQLIQALCDEMSFLADHEVCGGELSADAARFVVLFHHNITPAL